MRLVLSLKCILIAIVLATSPAASLASWSGPAIETPLDRVIANLSEHINKNPTDANLRLSLARAHSLAFTTKSRTLMTVTDSQGATFPLDARDQQVGRLGPKPGDLPFTHEELRLHAAQAITHFAAAVTIDKTSAIAYLGLASIMETARKELPDYETIEPPFSPKEPATPEELRALLTQASSTLDELVASPARAQARQNSMPSSLNHQLDGRIVSPRGTMFLPFREDPDPRRRDTARGILSAHWDALIPELYHRVYSMCLPSAERDRFSNLRPLLIEAGDGYLRTVRAHDDPSVDNARIDEVSTKLVEARAREQNIERLRSPILFSLTAPAPLPSLLDPTITTTFDLDATGKGERWPWLQPTTAILVYDPNRTGRITSGLQLFGSATFWLFFPNGYDAMDSLDDNRDGELAGCELQGLAVWFDRNQNGVSDPGEVLPIETLGIAALATKGHEPDPDHPHSLRHPTGLRMTDGRVLPTYDWFTSPIPQDPTSPSPTPQPTPTQLAHHETYPPHTHR